MRAVLVPLEIDPARPSPAAACTRCSGTSMGTDWSARMMLPPGLLPPAADAELQGILQHELDEIVAQMSHWDGGSLLSRYNRAPAAAGMRCRRSFSK
jgi:thiamine biosynthesis lipoprotein